MTPNETKILKFIWENNGVISIFKIAKAEGLGTDYLRLICEKLTKGGFITASNSQYRISDFGKTRLEDLGLIKKTHSANSDTISLNLPKVCVTKLRQARHRKHKKEKKTKDLNIKTSGTALAQLSISPQLKGALVEKGFTTLEAVAVSAVPRLMETIKDLKLKEAARMINEARLKLKKEGKEYLWESH